MPGRGGPIMPGGPGGGGMPMLPGGGGTIIPGGPLPGGGGGIPGRGGIIIPGGALGGAVGKAPETGGGGIMPGKPPGGGGMPGRGGPIMPGLGGIMPGAPGGGGMPGPPGGGGMPGRGGPIMPGPGGIMPGPGGIIPGPGGIPGPGVMPGGGKAPAHAAGWARSLACMDGHARMQGGPATAEQPAVLPSLLMHGCQQIRCGQPWTLRSIGCRAVPSRPTWSPWLRSESSSCEQRCVAIPTWSVAGPQELFISAAPLQGARARISSWRRRTCAVRSGAGTKAHAPGGGGAPYGGPGGGCIALRSLPAWAQDLTRQAGVGFPPLTQEGNFLQLLQAKRPLP
jgi:hypothetical protein